MVRLHGTILIEILEGKHLPDLDKGFFSLKPDVSDPYVTVDLMKGKKRLERVAKTKIIDDCLYPKWEESFRVQVRHDDVDSIYFDVKDFDYILGAQFMGRVAFSAEDLVNGETMSGWYQLRGPRGKPAGSILIALGFENDRSLNIVESNAEDSTAANTQLYGTNEVPNVVFPMRTGCRVRLYQDAHTPAVPPITDVVCGDGKQYQPTQMWVELTAAMKKAKKLIYILGWSVMAEVELYRGGEENETLSEILQKKANEGVRVLIMLWDDASSNDLNPRGMMNIHDEKTKKHFEGTNVEVVLAPRQKKGAKVRGQVWASAMYTHHQKCIVLDAENEQDESRRRLIAFNGGLDLTTGRWDTPAHELFSTLQSDHKNDFYNKVVQSTGQQGPRQPWHDVHMLVEGEPALDVAKNFIERWKCQAADREDRLISLEDNEFDLNWSAPKNETSWNVQLFRSINTDSAIFDEGTEHLLKSKKGRQYDDSIQQAYIHHIRRAKRFIYIENQYFLGSSSAWRKPIDKSPHLIPLEITAKIENCIKAGRDFKVYVLIPMHSEGDPKAKAPQEILRWQRFTMEMMYGKIAAAIEEKGLDAHPTDYISFFCLGKRESRDQVPEGLTKPPKNTVAHKVRQSLRMMIYVHSKMAIFDDEYIIVGSANINERSMNGNRDTEICLGAYQPDFTKERCGKANIAGQIRDFRLALWAEHCGAHMEHHLRPASPECMAKMKELGEANLAKYIAPELIADDSRWMSYPLHFSRHGSVEKRPGLVEFPDTGGAIFGSSNMLPDGLTT